MKPSTCSILFLLGAVALFASCSSDGAGTDGVDMSDGGTQADCVGCLQAGVCVNGDQPDACGAQGELCIACDPGAFCTESGRCVSAPSCGPENCAGCCDANGLCADGEVDSECGTSGLVCQDCAGEASCENNVCVARCGPDTCAGCCSPTGECVTGDDDVTCGRGGALCSNCQSITSVCSVGQCVAPACAASCGGCCAGEDCIVVANANQCGAAGAACVDCGPGRTCSVGSCIVDPESKWTIALTNGAVAPLNMGESWDGFNGLPDPHVEFDLGAITASSSVVDDSLAPVWNEDVVEVRASDLFGGMVIRFEDSDVALDDLICEITLSIIDGHPAFDGVVVQSDCANTSSFVRWRLVPK